MTAPASPELAAKRKAVTDLIDGKAKPVAAAVEAPFAGKTIALVHTSNLMGEIEPCG